MPPTAEELAAEEAKRKAEEEEAKRKAAESDEEDSDDEEQELTVEQLKAQLAEQKKHIKSLNKESADRRKKLEAFEKAEEERKAAELTEAQKATQRAEKAEAEKLALAKENQTLKLQRDFESKARDANLQFKNSLAAKDAFHALTELMEDDETEVTDDHLKQLVKERSYYFGTPDPENASNDAGKKGKSNEAALTKEAVASKKKSL